MFSPKADIDLYSQNKVVFINIKEQYTPNTDLKFCYKLIDYEPQEGDRVAIYKLDWVYVKDYYMFEWAPCGDKKENYIVTFDKSNLPTSTTDFYQICYINAENELYGASSSFQFIYDDSDSRKFPLLSHNAFNIEESEKDKEIRNLQEEIKFLRICLTAAFGQKTPNEIYEEQVGKLEKSILNLTNFMEKQQQEISFLKGEISKTDFLKSCGSQSKINLDAAEEFFDFSIEDLDIGSLPPMPVLQPM